MTTHTDLHPAESTGISRRTLMKGAAWAVPAIALVSAAPAFAASGGGSLSLSGGACKLPGNSNAAYKDGYVFKLSAENTTKAEITVTVTSVTLGGVRLSSPVVLNLDPCDNLGTSFQVPANSSLPELAIIATNSNSANDTLVVSYTISTGGETYTASTTIASTLNPLQGGCTVFTDAQAECIAKSAA